jgi:hypothetical protein
MSGPADLRTAFHGADASATEATVPRTLEALVRQVREMARLEEGVRSSLAAAVAAEREAQGNRIVCAQESSSQDATAGDRHDGYDPFVGRIRAAVEAAVPAGATVAVVSKGDPKLLELGGGRRAWHLPQTASGVYAGHHPADGAAALEQLEALRRKGAQYLLLPGTSSWWLDHYAEFRRHLEGTCDRLHADDACAVYSLNGKGKPASQDVAARQARYQETIRHVRRIVEAAVPADAVVAVVSRGDANLIDFAGRRGWHFPQAPNGAWAGHHPADGADAIRRLRALRAKGARYLALPQTAFWWLEHYEPFKRHLEGRHHRLHADEMCVVFELRDEGTRRGKRGRRTPGRKASSASKGAATDRTQRRKAARRRT